MSQEGGCCEHENENDRRRDARDADDTRVVEAPDVVEGTEEGGTEGASRRRDHRPRASRRTTCTTSPVLHDAGTEKRLERREFIE